MSGEARLEAANKILARLSDQVHTYRLEWGTRKDGRQALYMCHRRRNQKEERITAVLEPSQRSIGWKYNNYGWGGTNAFYVGQLIRFVENKPRYPLRAMQYWSDKEREILTAAGWDEPAMICCQACGQPIEGWVDWYLKPGHKGPAHGYISCLEKYTNVKEAV